MKIGVLGTGVVGRTIAAKLVSQGHEVRLGSRSSGEGTYRFADAAAWAELLFNATKGEASLDALRLAGAGNIGAKVLVDLANPLDFSKGMPPTLFVKDDDSLGERIQREFPKARVVKCLNTMNSLLMVDPSRLKEEHDVFISGNDASAKAQVADLLRSWGWKNIRDLGDITTARGTEMLLPLWLRLWGALGHADYNFHIAT